MEISELGTIRTSSLCEKSGVKKMKFKKEKRDLLVVRGTLTFLVGALKKSRKSQ